MLGYDIIGDVHGAAAKLEGLLHALGYRDDRGSWRHPDRQAIFVGDLIDRGNQQLDTLKIVRDMLDLGSAQIVMGNHEFSAVAFATRDPKRPDRYLRGHSVKNHEQHEAFLAEVTFDSTLHRDVVSWFRTFPLWIELDGIRVVHACWYQPSIDIIADRYGSKASLDDEFIVAANTNDDPVSIAAMNLLKGPAVTLSDYDAPAYRDSDGDLHSTARLRWWDPWATTLRDATHLPPGATTKANRPYPKLAKTTCHEIKTFRYPKAATVPVFFGHYWSEGPARLSGPQTVCTDYGGVMKGRSLFAYRHTPGELLDDDNFIGYPLPKR